MIISAHTEINGFSILINLNVGAAIATVFSEIQLMGLTFTKSTLLNRNLNMKLEMRK